MFGGLIWNFIDFQRVQNVIMLKKEEEKKSCFYTDHTDGENTGNQP